MTTLSEIIAQTALDLLAIAVLGRMVWKAARIERMSARIQDRGEEIAARRGRSTY